MAITKLVVISVSYEEALGVRARQEERWNVGIVINFIQVNIKNVGGVLETVQIGNLVDSTGVERQADTTVSGGTQPW